MLEHYASGANTRYLKMSFFNILLPVITNNRHRSISSPVFCNKTDKEEVYEGVVQTLEG